MLAAPEASAATLAEEDKEEGCTGRPLLSYCTRWRRARVCLDEDGGGGEAFAPKVPAADVADEAAAETTCDPDGPSREAEEPASGWWTFG